MSELFETLRQAQRFGFFGSGDVGHMAAHSAAFADALHDVPAGSCLIDLGSGGGLPGLVIASLRCDINILLADRRQKRTDFLRRATIRLGLDHVAVECVDIDEIRQDVRSGVRPAFDAVTARGFGPLSLFIDTVVDVLDRDGVAVISEPPTGDRWDGVMLGELGLQYERLSQVARLSFMP